MSRTFIVLLVITLGFPVLAFVAAALAAGANPDLISAGVTFFVVLTAVTAMVFEIKRLADRDAGAH
jgi:membrane protein implicated in regulation of membrane protease activity